MGQRHGGCKHRGAAVAVLTWLLCTSTTVSAGEPALHSPSFGTGGHDAIPHYRYWHHDWRPRLMGVDRYRDGDQQGGRWHRDPIAPCARRLGEPRTYDHPPAGSVLPPTFEPASPR